jgi:hypothetical protein
MSKIPAPFFLTGFITFLFIFNALRNALPLAQFVYSVGRRIAMKAVLQRGKRKSLQILILECSSIVNLTTHDCKIARSPSPRCRDEVHLLISFSCFQYCAVSYTPSIVCLPVISTSVTKTGHYSCPAFCPVMITNNGAGRVTLF